MMSEPLLSNFVQAQSQPQSQSQLPTRKQNNILPDSVSLNIGSNSFATNESAISGGLLTYQNPLYGLSLQYPSDWSYQEYEPSPDYIAFHVASFFPPVKEDPNFSTELKITIENLNSPIALNQYTRDSINYYSNNTQNFSVVSASTEDISLSERPAYEILFSENVNDTEIKTYEIGTIDNNKVYYLTFSSPVFTYDRIFPTVETMIGSFELESSRDSNGFDGDGVSSLIPNDSFSGLSELQRPSEDIDMQNLELFMNSFANSIFNGSSVFGAFGTSMVNGIKVSGISLSGGEEDTRISNSENARKLTVTMAGVPGETPAVTVPGTGDRNSSVTIIAARIPVNINSILSLAAIGSASSSGQGLSSFMEESPPLDSDMTMRQGGDTTGDSDGLMGTPFSQGNLPQNFNPFEFLSTLQIGSASLVDPDWSVPQSVSMSLIGNSDNDNGISSGDSRQLLSFSFSPFDIVLVNVIPYTGIDIG